MTLLEKLAELEKIALGATQQEWFIDESEIRADLSPYTTALGVSDCTVMVCDLPWINKDLDHRKPNRNHIVAFQPKEVLKLIAALKDAREALEFYANPTKHEMPKIVYTGDPANLRVISEVPTLVARQAIARMEERLK